MTFVDYNFRFGTGIEQLRLAVAAGGKIACAKIRFLDNKLRAPLWGYPSVVTSFLYVVGIHAIDLAVLLLGDAAKVSAHLRRLADSQFTLSVMLTSSDGRIALLDLGNYANRFESRIELVTESGLVGILDDLRHLHLSGNLGPDEGRFPGKQSVEYAVGGLRGGFAIRGFEGALVALRDAILQGEPSPASIEGSLAVYQIIKDIIAQCGE